MYHRVARETFDPWGLAVSPEHFREQLRWLSDNRVVLPLADFAALHDRRVLPSDAAAITFDDGYQCIAQVAVPLLNEAGLPATIFIPADLIERRQPFWWDELKETVLGHDGVSMTVSGERIPLGNKDAGDPHWRPAASPRTPRQMAFHRIWDILHEMTPTVLDNTMANLRGQCRGRERANGILPMTPAEVRSIASDRIDVGSHALTHPRLTSLDRRQKMREIRGSVEKCRALSGSNPRTFAYPYGNCDAESEALVEEAGFACACATEGAFVSAKSRLFALPRLHIGNWHARKLASVLGHA